LCLLAISKDIQATPSGAADKLAEPNAAAFDYATTDEDPDADADDGSSVKEEVTSETTGTTTRSRHPSHPLLMKIGGWFYILLGIILFILTTAKAIAAIVLGENAA
jgi:hypothetical protein